MTLIDKAPSEVLLPRYDLSNFEMNTLERGLIEEVKAIADGGDDLFAVWLSPHSSYADIVRTQESYYWPTIDEIMRPHEDRSLFLTLVDTRKGRDEVVHGCRITGDEFMGDLRPSDLNANDVSANTTGIVLIDDIINSGQGLTADDFRTYYESRGFDRSKFISVETNFRRPGMATRIEHYNGLPAAQIGYLALFQLFDKQGLSHNESAIFASLNQDSIRSLELMGVEYSPLVGRADLMTPVENGKFDPDYKPVALPTTEENIQLFRDISAFAAPTISL